MYPMHCICQENGYYGEIFKIMKVLMIKNMILRDIYLVHKFFYARDDENRLVGN